MGIIAEREKVRLVNAYQALEYRPSHPQLECPYDHALLSAVEQDGKAILVCPLCDYTQNSIPGYALLGDWVDPQLIEMLEEELNDELCANLERALAKRFAPVLVDTES
jgi:hypothetical protein